MGLKSKPHSTTHEHTKIKCIIKQQREIFVPSLMALRLLAWQAEGAKHLFTPFDKLLPHWFHKIYWSHNNVNQLQYHKDLHKGLIFASTHKINMHQALPLNTRSSLEHVSLRVGDVLTFQKYIQVYSLRILYVNSPADRGWQVKN